MSSSAHLQPLRCAVIGAGLGELCAAIALRRQGHYVTMYERYDFTGELEPASESYLAGPIFWKSKGRLTCQDQSLLCGMVCFLGDAAHPMISDQNQGFAQA